MSPIVSRPLLATLSVFLSHVNKRGTLRSILEKVREDLVLSTPHQKGTIQRPVLPSSEKEVEVVIEFYGPSNILRRRDEKGEREEMAELMLGIVEGIERSIGGRAVLRINQR